MRAVGERDDIDVIGVYAEGFNNLDGLDFVRAVREVSASGKLVVFYKAGRTPSGRSAAAGHTASVAGDYDVCLAATANAGALVVESFKEFEQLVDLATALHGKSRAAFGAVPRLGAVSNAGFETVGMADAVIGRNYRVEMATLSDESKQKLVQVLTGHKLGKLVNARNPLDLTPMATDQAYAECVRVVLDSPDVDAVIASLVPLTPSMLTTPDEIAKPGSLVELLPKLFAASDKPVVVNVDAGNLYEPMARALRLAGLSVFRSCDQAAHALGRYLCHRWPQHPSPATHD